MNNWKYEINIKQHLIADGDFADFAESANKIAAEFRKLPEQLYKDDFTTQDDLWFLESCNEQDYEVYESVQDYIDEMNYRLNSLYDFADRERIWLGL